MARLMWISMGICFTLLAVNLAPGQVSSVSPGPEQIAFDKVISVTCRSDPEYGVLLQDVRLQRIGDMVCLVGTGADSGQPGNWIVGAKIDIPLEDVSRIVEFKSVEEYLKRGLAR